MADGGYQRTCTTVPAHLARPVRHRGGTARPEGSHRPGHVDDRGQVRGPGRAPRALPTARGCREVPGVRRHVVHPAEGRRVPDLTRAAVRGAFERPSGVTGARWPAPDLCPQPEADLADGRPLDRRRPGQPRVRSRWHAPQPARHARPQGPQRPSALRDLEVARPARAQDHRTSPKAASQRRPSRRRSFTWAATSSRSPLPAVRS